MGNKYLINCCQCNFDDNRNILNSNLEIYNLILNTTIFSTPQSYNSNKNKTLLLPLYQENLPRNLKVKEMSQ